MKDGGAAGGSAVGRLAHALPPRVQAGAAKHGFADADRTVHPLRRPCGRRDTKLTHGQRLAGRSSRSGLTRFLGCWVSGGPASGLAGSPGDDLARAQQTKRSGVSEQRASSSSRAVVRVPAKDIRACDPRPREGPPSARTPASPARPCCAKDGSPKGRDAGSRPVARRAARQPDAAQRGRARPPCPRRPLRRMLNPNPRTPPSGRSKLVLEARSRRGQLGVPNRALSREDRRPAPDPLQS